MLRAAREVAAGRVRSRARRRRAAATGRDDGAPLRGRRRATRATVAPRRAPARAALRPRDALVAGADDFARLLAIPEIGTWTVEMLALHGLGRLDVVPAGDLGYLKLVGRLSDRATRRRSPTRPRCAGSSPPTRRGPASPRSYLIRARTIPGPRPGRNSLVSGGASEGGRLSRLFARIQRS